MNIHRIGFVGIGAMGLPMAERLVAAGHQVVVFDVNHEAARTFTEKWSIEAASTPELLARDAEIVITMLPNSAIVEQVVCGPEGVVKSLKPGSVVLEMSSGVPSDTVRISEQVAAAGSSLVDAPVSGGVPRAATGELTIMVGGSDEAIGKVVPVLELMGTSILRTGAVGSGHAMKALNNLVSAGGFLIGIEALLIGKKFGLDPAVMVDVLNASTGTNNSTEKKFKQYVLSRSFDSGFRLDLMNKDLGIAMGIGDSCGVPTPFASLCKDLWASAEKAEVGSDHTAFARLCEMLAGIELSPNENGST